MSVKKIARMVISLPWHARLKERLGRHNDTSGGDSANGNRDYDHFYPGAGEPP
ncbi:Uncharacterised protein [Escherichia coli]|uniref:Uncharacterized protein n=1 Tax=Escherichia coli TaxID=562 RepID=A0A2X3JU36_ECOLX|nr:Uncharacterised protein [Escherichia coli]